MNALPDERVEGRQTPVRPVLVVRPPRRRRRHAAAAVAALAYAGAAAVVVWLVLPVLEREEPRGSGIAPPAAAAPAASDAPRSLLALRALAARAQRSVFVVEAGNARGAAFVAWTQPRQNRTYLLTARANVVGLLADGGRTVFVRRGQRFWTGRLWAADRESGLALVRLKGVLATPLWQDDDRPGTLTAGGRTFVVPPGDAAFAESDARVGPPGRFSLAAGYDPLYVGAPVVNADGQVGGVVVRAHPRGTAVVAPLASACEKLRRCSSS